MRRNKFDLAEAFGPGRRAERHTAAGVDRSGRTKGPPLRDFRFCPGGRLPPYGEPMTNVDLTARSVADVMPDVLERLLPVFDMVITEHLVVDAGTDDTYRAARELDFLTVRSPILAAAMFVRGLPAKIRGHGPEPLQQLRLAADSLALPGWLLLGDVPGREVAFGAIGKFWKADIEWRDVPIERFATFDEPGWGKIGCRFLVRPDGPGRSILTYECRTGTTDPEARRTMARYWWLIRPFVGHILRATLRTIAANAETHNPSTQSHIDA
jgi:hypothetical protein